MENIAVGVKKIFPFCTVMCMTSYLYLFPVPVFLVPRKTGRQEVLLGVTGIERLFTGNVFIYILVDLLMDWLVCWSHTIDRHLFARPVLHHGGRFSHTPHAVLHGNFFFPASTVFCGKLVLHSSCCLMLEVSLIRPCFINNVGIEFLWHAPCGEFLFHAVSCIKWGVCLTVPLLYDVGSLSCRSRTVPTEGVCLRRPVLYHVGSLFYTLRAVWCVEFVLQA